MSEPTASDVVTFDQVSKSFGSIHALDSVSFSVPRGSVYGVVGPNGSGKTTLFSIAVGLARADIGRVEVFGYQMPTAKPEVRGLYGFMPDAMGLYDRVTAREFLEFFVSTYRKPAVKGRIEELLEIVGLTDYADNWVDNLSRGMKQRLQLARTLVHDPELLILDEPASGLDPRARVELRELLAGLAEAGKTIILSSHVLEDIERICTHIAILERGVLLYSGDITTLSDQAGEQTVRVVFEDGSDQSFVVATRAEQADLIANLVKEGRRVVEVESEGASLEAAFLRRTSGAVQ